MTIATFNKACYDFIQTLDNPNDFYSYRQALNSLHKLDLTTADIIWFDRLASFFLETTKEIFKNDDFSSLVLNKPNGFIKSLDEDCREIPDEIKQQLIEAIFLLSVSFRVLGKYKIIKFKYTVNWLTSYLPDISEKPINIILYYDDFEHKNMLYTTLMKIKYINYKTQ